MDWHFWGEMRAGFLNSRISSLPRSFAVPSPLSVPFGVHPSYPIICCLVAHSSETKFDGTVRRWTGCCGHADDGEDSPSSHSSSSSSLSDAQEAAAEVMSLFQHGDTDSIIAYLPDSVIDAALDQRRRSGKDGEAIQDMTDDEGLTALKLVDRVGGPDGKFRSNTVAVRVLMLSPPLSVQHMSTLQITPTECWQRFAVESPMGEEAMVTMIFELGEALEPRYRSARIVKRWFLTGIIGESMREDEDDLPWAPMPRLGPERVVGIQLDSLQCGDLDTMWGFMSPSFRSKLREDSFGAFVNSLREPSYRPLLHHEGAEILSARHFAMIPSRISVVVGLSKKDNSLPPSKYVYLWALQWQEDSRCWMTESIERLSDFGTLVFPV